MKKTSLLFFLPVAAIALTSCEQVIKYSEHLDDYVFTMDYHDNFKILQLTDIHWNYNTSTVSSKQYLDKVLAEAKKHAGQIDLVELTGDLFMLANAYHVDSFINYFEAKAEEYGFKYAVIWGNHDHHGLYNPNWLSSRFSNAKHCMHYDPNDDLYGRGNYVINLQAAGVTTWQIVNLDSGASFSETAVSPFREYDYIRKDQTDWWKKEHDKVGALVPAIAYYHIPQDENLKAWNEVQADPASHKNKFFKLEEFADNGMEEYESDFIDVGSENNLKAAFMGHAHNVDWTVDYKGVTIGLGVKTGTELYFAHVDASSELPEVKSGLASTGISENFDLIGASLVTLTSVLGTFDLEHLYLNERANEDFVKWVTY